MHGNAVLDLHNESWRAELSHTSHLTFLWLSFTSSLNTRLWFKLGRNSGIFKWYYVLCVHMDLSWCQMAWTPDHVPSADLSSFLMQWVQGISYRRNSASLNTSFLIINMEVSQAMRYMKSLLQTANYHSKITIIWGDNALFLSTFLPSRRTMVSLLPSLLPCPVKFLFLDKKGIKNRIDQICSAPQPFFPYSISLTIRK